MVLDVVGARGVVVVVCGEGLWRIYRGSAVRRGNQRWRGILWPLVVARCRCWSRKSVRDEGMNPEHREPRKFYGHVFSPSVFVK